MNMTVTVRIRRDQDWLDRIGECFLEKEGYHFGPQEMGRFSRRGQLCWERHEFYIEGTVDERAHMVFVRGRQI